MTVIARSFNRLPVFNFHAGAYFTHRLTSFPAEEKT